MGKINSKDKGARFERQLAGLFRDYGYSGARRTAQYCGNTGDASDVVGLPGIHVEAKHQEKIDYEEIKDKFPDPDEADNDLSRAQNILDGVKADDEGTKGGTPEPTE